MKTQPLSPINATVMKTIKSGHVRLKPRAYFLALACLAVGAITIATLVSTYLLSMLFYWVRIQTADTMAWGARQNLSESAASFPWWALALSVALLVVTAAFVRKQGRMYKHKITHIILVLVGSSLLLGYILTLVNIGPLHPQQHQPRGHGRAQSSQHR